MNVRRLRKTFLELLRLNAPSRKEKPVADYVKAARARRSAGPRTPDNAAFSRP